MKKTSHKPRGASSLPSPMKARYRNHNRQEEDISKIIRHHIEHYFRSEVQRELRLLLGNIGLYKTSPLLGGAAEVLVKNAIYDVAHIHKKPLAAQLIDKALSTFFKQF